MIRALIVKDITLYFRNQFFAVVSVLGVVAYIAIYFLMPRTVDDTLAVGIYPPDFPESFIEETEDSGIVFIPKESEDALRAGMTGKDEEYNVAFLLPDGFLTTLATGQTVEEDVTILFTSDFPDDLKEAYVVILEELSYTVSRQPLNINVDEEVLGPDLAGEPIAARDRMIPLMAVFVLMVEMMGLASLISSEVEGRTLQAILSTPVRVADIFISKGATGVTLAFVQSLIVVAAIGGLARQPWLIVLALLLGSILVTGIAFLVASGARDLMGVMAFSMPGLIVMSIPTFGIVFPGGTTAWTRAIPTYYLVDVLHQVMNFGAGWADVWGSLLALVAFCVGFVALGMVALRRRFR